MTDPWTEQLSDYVDGELSADEQRRLEVHLATCADCASVLAGLREVVQTAQTLESSAPPMDLWPGIAARIAVDASPVGAPVTAKRAATRRGLLDWLDRRFTITVPQALAAAAALALVVGFGAWQMASHPASPGTVSTPQIASRIPTPTPSVTQPRADTTPAAGDQTTGPSSPDRSLNAATATTASTASSGGIDRRYDATIAELQRVLAEERSRLDPKTVQVLETNLAIIDRAVTEAKRAVDADPSNFYLRNHLASVMKRKADLLRQATLLAQEQGSEG